MANLNFNEDLVLGNHGEIVIKEFLETKGCEFINLNDNNQYDLKMKKNNNEITYEIKTDVLVAPIYDTGNIFIEYESRGKKSGISVTKSDWFVTYFKYLKEIWFIKSETLKNLIQNNEFPIFYDAGDVGSATHGYLIKRKDFKEYFHVYKI
jgi:hypothetical protein